jgi:hypothetical protein
MAAMMKPKSHTPISKARTGRNAGSVAAGIGAGAEDMKGRLISSTTEKTRACSLAGSVREPS